MTPTRRIPLLLLPLLAALALPSAAAASKGPVARASYVPGEVVVRYKRSADRAARAAVQRETGVGRPRAFAPRTRVLKIRDGQSTAETLRELRARPEVATAAPNPVARVTGFIPADPGRAAVRGRLAADPVELPRRDRRQRARRLAADDRRRPPRRRAA